MGTSRTAALLLLIATALLSLSEPGRAQGLSSWGRRDAQPEVAYPDVTVTTEWLVRHNGESGVVVVDARPESSYLSGHIPGAVSLPARVLPVVCSVEDVRSLGGSLGAFGVTGTELLICCGETSWSAEAATLFWLLELAGAERAAILDGGVTGWLADARPLSVEPTRARGAGWSREPDVQLLATLDHVVSSYGADGVEIIDARGRYEWGGPIERDEWECPPRAGHIPHALPFDFTVFFHPDGFMRTPAETRSEFARLGPRPANPVDLASEFVVHGDGFVSDGAIGYFLLRRAGLERVRYYPGGWGEWSTDLGLPVVRIVGADELMWRLSKGRRLFASDAPASGFAFFDVRHPADYARGHIRGSVSLRSDHFADSLDTRLERFWPKLDRKRAPVVTYCYGEYCIRSRGTSTDAARAGFVRVERFYGGLDEWQAAGGRLVTSVWKG
ncbi:MAG: hypothetical protein JXB46_09940 [Candidatus Eisenbacteria bacterium]|nr:hypothetical protein [Candidatus Eisenbacteria bacterium]